MSIRYTVEVLGYLSLVLATVFYQTRRRWASSKVEVEVVVVLLVYVVVNFEASSPKSLALHKMAKASCEASKRTKKVIREKQREWRH